MFVIRSRVSAAICTCTFRIAMAGIRLPDIGKLGIRIATGIRDHKKVAPSNMAEDAKLKSLSRKLDNEKRERQRNLKKEEKRMRRKKCAIDKRRGLIGLNFAAGKLPRIPAPSLHASESVKFSADEAVVHESSNGAAVFPIQEVLVVENHEKRTVRDLGKSAGTPVDGLGTRGGKIILPSLGTYANESLANSKKNLNLSPSRKAKEPEFLICDGAMNDDEDNSEPKFQDSISSLRELTGERAESESFQSSANESDVISGHYSGERKRTAQQSLEEAFLAIQACRYIRTPSKQMFRTDAKKADLR